MKVRLPTVLVPVFNSLAGLDACVASLERTLPAGSTVIVADDASSDPNVESLARGWCERSKLDARYLRRQSSIGLAANCDAAIRDAEGEDIVLFKPDALATAGWLQQLERCAGSEQRSATIVPWSNHADLCSFPHFGEANPPPQFPEAIVQAAASVAWPTCPELPTAVGPCMYLRRAALRQIGGLDIVTFTGARALDDFCLRAAAMGWSNLLCPGAFIVSHGDESSLGIVGEELSRLIGRWPDYQERMARFIMSDPLRPLRERLQARIDELARGGPQRDLFH
jgi:GT2 family glycosyltransferase